MKRLLPLILLIACAQTEPKKSEVTFNHNVVVDHQGHKLNINKKGKYVLPLDKPTKISAPGKVSLLLYPYAPQSQFKISLPKIEKKNIEQYQLDKINKTVDLIMPEIQKVQKFILDKDFHKAISKIKKLKGHHPKIAYLSFLEGACYSMLGNKSAAKKALQDGFKISPHNKNAKQLYREISGEKQ